MQGWDPPLPVGDTRLPRGAGNHRVSIDYRTTCIIGRVSVEHDYWKWAGPSVDTTDLSHIKVRSIIPLPLGYL